MKPDRNENEPRRGGVLNIKEKRPPTEDATLAVRVAGTVEAGDVRVFLPLEVFEELERRVMKNPDQEWSGLLLGDLYRSTAYDYLEVEGFLPLRDSSARFTQETWESVYAELDRRSSDTNIIGWFYSDPSGNLALDGYRQFVQESFFDDPYQVAMGIDPNSGRYRFFEWKDGDLAPLPGLYIFAPTARAEEVRRLAGRPLAEVRSGVQGQAMRVQSRRPQAGGFWRNLVLLFAVLLSLGNLFWTVVLMDRMDQVEQKAKGIESAHLALAKNVERFEQVELAMRSLSEKLLKRPIPVSDARFSELERRLTDLQRNYTKLKIQLDRTTGSTQPPKPAPGGPAVSPSAPAPKPGTEPAGDKGKAKPKPGATATAVTPAAKPAASVAKPTPTEVLPPQIDAPADAPEAPIGPGGQDDSVPPEALPAGSDQPAEDASVDDAEESTAYETPLTAP